MSISIKKDGTRQSSPLLQATLVGHLDIQKLLEKNPEINFNDRDGFTPLLIACQNNKTEMVRL